MNLLDLFILILIVVAAMRGVATGFLRQSGSVGGFVVGLFVAAQIAPWLAARFAISPSRPAIVALLFFAVALTLSGVGETIGARLAAHAQALKLGSLNAILGAVFGVVGCLVAVWFLAATFTRAAGPSIAYDIQTSRIVTALDRALPPVPAVTARLERALGASFFPRVFVGLEPTPAPPVTGPNAAAINQAIAAGRAATVKIEGEGCGGVVEGSGFVAGDGLVITNAHVVAGINRPVIIDAAGTHPATTVVFDPGLDIAVLRANRLAAAPLPLATTNAPRGTIGAALGYPGGGNFTAGGAAILGRQTAVGRNIYGTGLVRRNIYELQAVVRPGNSGGPLVQPDGTVIGVIFATSTTNPSIGYALTSREAIPALSRAATASPTDTGPCAAD